MLEVRDLHTYYGGIAALRGISFDVPEGRVVALVGPNGAGKSTTLNTISGLLAPRQGTIRFADRDVTGWRAERVAALGLVQVPEGRQILAPLTVEENLLVEQNARKALRVADYAYVLEGGSIVQEGPAAALREDPRIVDAYLGRRA